MLLIAHVLVSRHIWHTRSGWETASNVMSSPSLAILGVTNLSTPMAKTRKKGEEILSHHPSKIQNRTNFDEHNN